MTIPLSMTVFIVTGEAESSLPKQFSGLGKHAPLAE